MFTWALVSSSWLGEAVGTVPQWATTTAIITVLTARAPSMIPFLQQRKRTNSESYFFLPGSAQMYGCKALVSYFLRNVHFSDLVVR